MESKFKVGDRIVFYQGSRNIGTILQIDVPTAKPLAGPIHVRYLNDRATTFVHEKQCRKLVKKPRRRAWVCSGLVEQLVEEAKIKGEGRAVKMWNPYDSGYIEFIEVKKLKNK